jgi:hypothetical protein
MLPSIGWTRFIQNPEKLAPMTCCWGPKNNHVEQLVLVISDIGALFIHCHDTGEEIME